MNQYETIFIMNNQITKEEQQAVIYKITSYIKENGTITKEDNIGVKKLAYEVKKQKEGYYYLIEFESNPSVIDELQRIYRITDAVLKFITIRKDD